MKDCPNYNHWKSLINIWVEVTDVPKPKQADNILLTLETDAQNLALQVSNEERRNPDGSGVTKLLEKLDSLYEQNSTQKLFTAFEEWESYRRTPGMSLPKYISGLEIKIEELKALKVSLPEELLAFRLLRYAGLNEEIARAVRLACNTNVDGPEALTFKKMKATILSAFDCRLETASTNAFNSQQEVSHVPTVEPFRVKEEPLDTFFTSRTSGRGIYRDRGKYRSTEPYPNPQNAPRRGGNRSNVDSHRGTEPGRFSQGRGTKRVNRLDNRTGKPIKCHTCGSIYHYAFDCSRNQQQRSNEDESPTESSLESHTVDMEPRTRTVDFNLLSQSFERTL